MIFNCPDTKGSKNYDVESIKNFLKNIKISTTLNNTNIKRVGKFAENSKRPICVTMKNRADVSAVFINWRSLPETYNVSADYTRLQRDLYKELKYTADDFNSNNPPVKKYIRYFKGTPELCFERSRSGNVTDASRNNLRNSTSPKNQ